MDSEVTATQKKTTCNDKVMEIKIQLHQLTIQPQLVNSSSCGTTKVEKQIRDK